MKHVTYFPNCVTVINASKAIFTYKIIHKKYTEMERTFNTVKRIGALAVATLAGIALGVILTLNQERNMHKEFVGDTKNMAKKLIKKAQKKAKNTGKE